jgi:hypothetical protein
MQVGSNVEKHAVMNEPANVHAVDALLADIVATTYTDNGQDAAAV